MSIHGADAGDTQTLPDTLAEAVEQLDRVKHAAFWSPTLVFAGHLQIGTWTTGC